MYNLFQYNQFLYDIPHARKSKAKPKSLEKLGLVECKPSVIFDPTGRIDAFMARIIFKGTGSRYSPPVGPEIQIRCNHKALPLNEASMSTQESLRWFFDCHVEDLETCYCFLRWLDEMTSKFQLEDKFCLKKWDLLEQIWEERHNIPTAKPPLGEAAVGEVPDLQE